MIIDRRFWKLAGKWLCGVLFVLAGVNHFRAPGMYMKIMPPYLPFHRPLVLISGVFQARSQGALLLVPQVSWLAAWGLIALLFAIFPANVLPSTSTRTFSRGRPIFHLLHTCH